MPTNINYQYQNSYDPNYWAPQRGSRYNYGNESASSFNKQYFDDFYTKRLNGGFLNMLNNKRVGILSGPKVDTSDFARYLSLLPLLATKYDLLSESLRGKDRVLSIGSVMGQNFGPSLQKIPADNGDGTKMYGMIAQLQYNQQQRWRFQVTDEMIKLTSTANNVIPDPTRPEIAANVERIVIPSNVSFIGELINGCLSCDRESCGKGYRTLFFHKNAYRNGTMPQGDYAGDLVTEVMFVLDRTVLPSGDLELIVKRGVNGQTYTDSLNQIQYDTAALPMEAGDFITVGTVAFSTECHPRDLGGCAVKRPVTYSFCEGVQEFADCLLCINKTQFATLQSDDLLSREEEMVYNFTENARTLLQRAYNEFLDGQKVYGAKFPMPQHPTLPIGNEFNGELIPNKISGILEQFDKRSKQLEITFDSCDQQCWEYGLATIIDAIEAGAEDGGLGKGSSYNSAEWIAVGDIKGLQKIYESRMANFAPNTLGDRQDQLMQFGKTYNSFDVTPRSLFKAANGNSAAIQNDFIRGANDFGIRLLELQLGNYTFKAIHDLQRARQEPGVIRLMNISDIIFFTDNQDEIMDRVGSLLGLPNSPYAKATAVEGKLVPSVISRSMAETLVNGNKEFLAKDDCGLSLYGYMRAGVFYSPENISRNLKIRINARIANPEFVNNPSAPATIKVPIRDLGCGCSRTYFDIVEGLDNWGNGPILTRPYNFASPTDAFRDAIETP